MFKIKHHKGTKKSLSWLLEKEKTLQLIENQTPKTPIIIFASKTKQNREFPRKITYNLLNTTHLALHKELNQSQNFNRKSEKSVPKCAKMHHSWLLIWLLYIFSLLFQNKI